MSESLFVLKKVQLAFREYLADLENPPAWLAGASFICGISRGANSDPESDVDQDSSVPLPRVVIECDSANHTAPFSGAWRAAVRIHLEESADDTSEEDHGTHAAALMDLLLTDSIASDLSAAIEDFTAQLVVFTGQSYQLRERLWVATYECDVECIGRNLA